MNIFFFGASSFSSQEILKFFKHKKSAYFFGRKRIDNVKNFHYFDLNKITPNSFSKIKINKLDYLIYFSSFVPFNENVRCWDKICKINIQGFIKVLLNIKYPIKKIILISSCAVYGKSKNKLIEENNLLKPLTDYSISKFSQEKILISFCKIKKIKFLIFRLGYVFGKNMDQKRLIKRIVYSKKNNKNFKIFNKNLNLNLISTKDISNVITKSYKKLEGVYNLTYTYRVSLNEFYEKIFYNKKIHRNLNNYSNLKLRKKLSNFKFQNINVLIDDFKKN